MGKSVGRNYAISCCVLVTDGKTYAVLSRTNLLGYPLIRRKWLRLTAVTPPK